MTHSVKNLILSAISALIICTASASAQQQSYMDIEVSTAAEPQSALGILFNSQKITQQTNTLIERVNPNLLIVRIPYDRSNASFNSGFVTAYVLTKDSELVFGSIKMLPPIGDPGSIWKLATCSTQNKALNVRIPVQEQLSYMDSLYQIRLKKRELLHKDLQDRLDPKTTASLQQIEDRFGFQYNKALNEESDPYELNIRLHRLREAIQMYKRNKAKS